MATMAKWSLLGLMLLVTWGTVEMQTSEKVTVGDSQSSTYLPPDPGEPSVVVTITAEDDELDTGDDIALTCARDSLDDSDVNSVTFYKGGSEIATWAHHCEPHDDYGDRDVSCAQLDGEKKHTLDIRDAIEDDTGDYECAVAADSGTFDSDTIGITVTAGGNGGTPSLLHNLWMLASLGLVWLLRA